MRATGPAKRQKKIASLLAENIDYLLSKVSVPNSPTCDYKEAARILGYDRNSYAAFVSGHDIRYNTVAKFAERLGINLPVLFSRKGKELLAQYLQGSYCIEDHPEKYLANFRQNILFSLRAAGKPLQTLYDRDFVDGWNNQNHDGVKKATIFNLLSPKQVYKNPLISTLGWSALCSGYDWGDIGMLMASPTLLHIGDNHLLVPLDKNYEEYLFQPADYKEE